ncbi:histidine phosphatase family protein [Campylobacter sp. 19-13652]|uniref:SixA phosphatase family protein n=1 Tax=Campylobacter sp. 19-13652 TaxID=2840180 RepID=UPI001C789250|nr:histidine phosphatase family protein [Campylobacter sp. 19-13652]BCX79436.1 phosphoglycerate mutase [Campylobacter sp. 19-13652]
MKKIYLIRHAKAEKTEKIDDFERELNARGKEDIKIMAASLLSLDIVPDAVYTSVAKRCIQTAKRFCDILKFKGKIEVLDGLYQASANDIISLVLGLNSELNEVFIIGHNPAITEASEVISHSIIDAMPTCGICCIEFENGFLDTQHTKLAFFDFPKNHKNS